MQRFCSDLKVRYKDKDKNTNKTNNNYDNIDYKYMTKEENESDLSDLETDDRISKPIKNNTINNDIMLNNINQKQKPQHGINVFASSNNQCTNLDDLPPIKFRW